MRRIGTLLLLLSLTTPALADSLLIKRLDVRYNTTTLKFKGPAEPSANVVNKLSGYAAKAGLAFRASRNFLTGTTTVRFDTGKTTELLDREAVQKIVVDEHVPESSLE